MISTFRNFTKKKFAGLLLILVIIIAFGFGGFGGGFNPRNQNNIVKINNTNISTEDFINYLNQSGLSQSFIKENIDKNILEELLTTLVSTTILDLEIKDLKLTISEDVLIKKIKKNTNFHNENGKFQRTIYEKFLLSNNITAPMYEIKLKNKLLQKQLFTYLSGGTKSPIFLINKYYMERNNKLSIDYINLNKFYKSDEDFTKKEIQNFLDNNSDKLKQEYIDFSYVELTPKNLLGLEEFNQAFFNKIDEIEDQIFKNIDFKTIVKELDIKPIIKKNYIKLEDNETVESKIYNSRADKIEIFEDKGSYIFYQIDKINTELPSLDNDKFKKQIKNLLFQKEKFEFNQNILKEINEKKFNQISFNNFGKDNIKKIKLNSITDNNKFHKSSIEILYSLPVNAFTLIIDNEDNVFIAKIVEYEEKNISQNSDIFNSVSLDTDARNRNIMLKSYDYFLNDKYKVVVNKKTLDSVKNYFK
jgi:peptidyl-prolyl cis-trans isomerase D